MTHLDVYNVCQNHVDFAIQRKELISTSSERMHLVNSMLRAQRQGLTSSDQFLKKEVRTGKGSLIDVLVFRLWLHVHDHGAVMKY